MWSFCQSPSNGDRRAGELLRILLYVARILALSLCVGLLAGGSNRAHSSQMGVTRGVATIANESVLDVPKFNHRNPGASPVGIGGCAPAPTVPITWSSRINVSNNAGVSLSPALAIDTAGTLYAVWYDNSISGNLDVLYASKEPDQQSWSAPVIISNTPGSSYWPAIAIDATDNVHAAWEDGGTGRDILYATKPARSADWTEPVNLSTSPGTARFVALAGSQVGATGPGDDLDLAPYPAKRSIPYGTASFLVPEGVSGFIRVVDEGDNPVAGATAYVDGQPIGVTDQDGLLDPGSLEIGTALVALAQQAEQPASRNAHDGWAYRTFLSSLTLDAEGDPQPFIVSGPGEQRLVVRRNSPLILFNLLVSIEWDADVTYTEEISRAIQSASDYLYDITDAQMAFGQAAIYDDAEHWTDADIHISVRNVVRPHAHVGGINSADPAHAIKLGRGWDGNSGNQGPWDQPDGYRTLIHQFGHYALYLYDEYFGYIFDQYGNPVGEVPAYCTGPENRNPATDATNASVMDYPYTTTELSARDVPGLWSPLCEQTAQWQLNGESAWETVARTYSDTTSPPRWEFITPMERGSVLTGPTSLPPDILALPQVEVHQTGTSPPVRQLTVYGPNSEAYGGANVSLHKQDGQIIDQGLTDRNGQLDIYGAAEGDTIQAVALDGGLEGSVTVGTATSLTLVLEPQYKIYLPMVVK